MYSRAKYQEVKNLKKIKALIQLSRSVQEVDEIFEKYTNIVLIEDKIEFLEKNFKCSLFCCDKLDQDSYVALVHTIIL